MAEKPAKSQAAEQEAEKPAKAGKPKWLKGLLIALLALALIGGGAGAALLIKGWFSHGSSNSADAGGGEDAADAQDSGDAEESADAGGESSKESGPAVYKSLDPPFVVNFDGQGKARFLQASLQVMTRNEDVVALLDQHMPAIRNTLVMLLSAQKYEEIGTSEGKEALREQARDAIQKILDEENSEAQIEAVYFTSFVMQ